MRPRGATCAHTARAPRTGACEAFASGCASFDASAAVRPCAAVAFEWRFGARAGGRAGEEEKGVPAVVRGAAAAGCRCTRWARATGAIERDRFDARAIGPCVCVHADCSSPAGARLRLVLCAAVRRRIPQRPPLLAAPPQDARGGGCMCIALVSTSLWNGLLGWESLRHTSFCVLRCAPSPLPVLASGTRETGGAPVPASTLCPWWWP